MYSQHKALATLTMTILMQCTGSFAAEAQNSDTTSGATASRTMFTDSEQPLFSTPLFSGGALTGRLDQDVQNAAAARQSQAIGIVAIQQQAIARADYEMRRQMRSVARYLSQYCLRNHSEFPGIAGDEQTAVITQLAQLVPTNPYAATTTGGTTYGISTMYDSNGAALSTTNSWSAAADPDATTPAMHGRLRLQMDYSVEPNDVDIWKRTAAPDGWNAAPGTITVIGNNEGFFVVWGAGVDGRPVKDSSGTSIYLVPVTVSGTGADQEPPNAY